MEFIREPGRIYLEDADKKTVAEVVYTLRDGVATIDHTFVNDSLRGQGVAGKLLTAVTQYLRGENVRVVPVCQYAKVWFDGHPTEQDLLRR